MLPKVFTLMNALQIRKGQRVRPLKELSDFLTAEKSRSLRLEMVDISREDCFKIAGNWYRYCIA